MCYMIVISYHFYCGKWFGAVDEVVDGHIHDDYRIEYLKAHITAAIEAKLIKMV